MDGSTYFLVFPAMKEIWQFLIPITKRNHTPLITKISNQFIPVSYLILTIFVEAIYDKMLKWCGDYWLEETSIGHA